MTMSKKTSEKIRKCIKEVQPFTIIRTMYIEADSHEQRDNVIKYWKQQGWITRNGSFYVLTNKGYEEI